MLTVNESLGAGETTIIHLFEKAGLGKAPFRFTGEVTEKTFCAAPGSPVRAGSACDYCGTCIRYEFWVHSSDGKDFKVGCDCIHKTGDSGLITQIAKAERTLRDAKNKAARERKAAKLAARLELAKAKMPSILGVLSGQPHPNAYLAAQGQTKLDYVNWLLENHAEEKAVLVVENAS